jgi:hypothetical protein
MLPERPTTIISPAFLPHFAAHASPGLSQQDHARARREARSSSPRPQARSCPSKLGPHPRPRRVEPQLKRARSLFSRTASRLEPPSCDRSMQAGPSRLAGQTRRCCRAFSSHGSPRCKAAPAVIGPDGADRAASAPLVSTTKSPGNLPLPSSPAASKSATAPQDGPTRAETTSRPDDRPQQPTQRARTGPQPASLGYPSIVRESPFVPRTAETTKGKERRLLVAESLKKLKVDGGRVEASPVFKGLLKREDDLPALPNKWSVRVVPATASTSEKVIWPAEIAQRALETLDPRLIVQVRWRRGVFSRAEATCTDRTRTSFVPARS